MCGASLRSPLWNWAASSAEDAAAAPGSARITTRIRRVRRLRHRRNMAKPPGDPMPLNRITHGLPDDQTEPRAAESSRGAPSTKDARSAACSTRSRLPIRGRGAPCEKSA